MNRQEFRQLIVRLYAIEPAYQAWVEDQVASLAPAVNVSDDEAYEGMVAEWMRAVGQYTAEEMGAVIDAIAATQRQFPTYSKLWRTMAGYAAENRQGRREAERYRRESEPRFRCLDCHDAGRVTVYNPAFLRWLRPTFVARRASGPAWYWRARSEWHRRVVQAVADGGRGQETAPAEVALVCHCDCPEALVYRRQLTAMIESLSDPSAKPKRAAYIGQWTPSAQCLVADHGDELAAWFDQCYDGEDFQWRPATGSR